ncbi:hypothetical protein [Arthrobacter sp. GMC3]|uniref:hypothetical protein n=1 Tax=Arthrobacter sp. GMC3 TaxID=2058894 RepID=UPI0015E2892F|nr:hypothetical protein [Arthrobacter sp. GMC3]
MPHAAQFKQPGNHVGLVGETVGLSAQEVDFHATYDSPYGPEAEYSERDNSRIEPRSNDSGMWSAAILSAAPATKT